MKYGVNTGFGLRSALMLGAASVTAMGMAGGAFAQQQGTVETVVVTGSRIPQQGLYSSSPVTAVGQQELKFEGTSNVENLINNLPQAFADQGQTASNAASGTAAVNLRDLGPKRTLVLIDGKRLMPGDPDAVSHANGGVADLDFIPAALVDHVEVLSGGASATYGSDALAGVVNFIMRKDFEGIEVDGQYSVTNNVNGGNYPRPGLGGVNPVIAAGYKLAPGSILDGATDDATLLIGANTDNGKGNVTLYATYEDTQPVLESTRDFSDCATGSYGTYFRCGGSSTVPEGRFISVDAASYDLTAQGQLNPAPAKEVPALLCSEEMTDVADGLPKGLDRPGTLFA
jgi:outer membrane receptor protein involved in Fe transport